MDANIKFSAKEAAQRVLWRADDRFAADVETGVDENRAASQFFKSGKESVKARIDVGACITESADSAARLPVVARGCYTRKFSPIRWV